MANQHPPALHREELIRDGFIFRLSQPSPRERGEGSNEILRFAQIDCAV